MTALKTAEIDKFIARPSAPVVLVYGSDAGLVRERVDMLLRASVDDIADPFSLVRIESDELAANPARLADEVGTVPLFGGRRAVLLRVSSRHNIVPSVEAVLDNPARDCRVIVEAGELRKTSPLRTVCEKSRQAIAIACYPDRVADLTRLIDEEIREAGLTIAPDARQALLDLLGGDRLASRSEMRKLALYARGKNCVELADIAAVVSDASSLGLDNIVDAAFAGDARNVEREFAKARADGASPAAIMSAAVRQVAQLHKMRTAIDDGMDAKSAMFRSGPPVHFSREEKVGTALRRWSPPRLLRAMQQLADATLDTRRQPALAETIAQRALLSLAAAARRKD